MTCASHPWQHQHPRLPQGITNTAGRRQSFFKKETDRSSYSDSGLLLARTVAFIVTVVCYIYIVRSHFLKFQAFLPIYLVFLFAYWMQIDNNWPWTSFLTLSLLFSPFLSISLFYLFSSLFFFLFSLFSSVKTSSVFSGICVFVSKIRLLGLVSPSRDLPWKFYNIPQGFVFQDQSRVWRIILLV